MIDIESTGTDPSHAAMIQLSAVRFDIEKQDIDTDMFDQCLLVPANRFWQEDTREWWAGQDQSIISSIWSRMREPAPVLREFAAWAMRDLDGDKPILWAKPISFEWPFLQSYFKEYGVASPFHYSDCKDLRSVLYARGMPTLDRDHPFEGPAHNAIFDVLHQIEVLFKCLEKTNVVHDAG